MIRRGGRLALFAIAAATPLAAVALAVVKLGGDGARHSAGPAAPAAGTARRPPPEPSARDLARAVTVAGMLQHLRALQRIGSRHGGTRAAGTPGARASVRYVIRRLRSAGYRVRRQHVAGSATDPPSDNVLADLPGSRRGGVVMAGGHLDSVPEGPGINDNGSGVAALLEIAEEVQELGVRPRRRLRFGFFGKEERGHLGSTAYVGRLSGRQRSRMTAYVNLDMLGSRNGGRFFYGGGRSRRDRRVVAAIERTMRRYLRSRGVPLGEVDLHGLSDHASFAATGIPVAGLYSGSDEVKTRRQQRAWGGRAGRPFDRCYHRPCDTLAGIDRGSLSELADTAAVAIHRLAMKRIP